MALRQTISQLGSTLIGAVSTRLELFALEAGQQKASLITIFSMVFGALLFSTLAVLVFSLLLALYFWPTDYRYWALGVLVVVYAGLGVGLFLAVRRRLTTGPIPFSATLSELRRDVAFIERLRDSEGDGK
ncbi:phage holin family protein [Alcaligenes phenolicus]|uniref:Phage holin family protein n=1 Tax=Alcaligenes phenolicus TaxID=232846 RepID=A0AAW5VJK7_9BURK|nr:phage holin family protein [Alcaligenes phenolicus]MCX5563995.1 phage holin family protein [Alcaligenes phenolicus]